MKLCLVLQRRFAYIGHAIAFTFKNRYPETAFCGYVNSRESYDFLNAQKEIAYTGLLFNEDVHERYKKEPLDLAYLAWLKHEYGIPNLWPYIEIDRITRFNQLIRDYPYNTPKYTHEEMMRILQVKAKAVLAFLEKEKPVAILTSVVSDTITLLLYNIAKKRGIKFLAIQEGRVNDEYAIGENSGGLSGVEELFAKLQKGEVKLPEERKRAETFIRDFRAHPTPYSTTEGSDVKPINRRKQFGFLLPANIFRSLRWGWRVIWGYITNRHKSDCDLIAPWHYFWDRIVRKLRILRGYGDLYDAVDPKDEYAFFPLHLEPEMALLLFAPFYTDQLWVIRHVARSLPIHYKLYVKEHPAMFGYRTRCFYKELKKIPSVKLINPSVTSFTLIKNAKLLTTITGTTGWEALLFKKPAITFGDVFYNALPMTKRCRAIEDLPNIVESQLSNFTYSEEALTNMVTAIFAESANLPIFEMWEVEGGSQMEKKKQQVAPLVELLARKLQLY